MLQGDTNRPFKFSPVLTLFIHFHFLQTQSPVSSNPNSLSLTLFKCIKQRLGFAACFRFYQVKRDREVREKKGITISHARERKEKDLFSFRAIEN